MGLFSRRPTQLPTTSYGYVPPPEATASGWKCTDEEQCGTGGQEIPRRWPFRCPSCGTEADPDFNEPWAHQARGPWLVAEVKKAQAKSGEWPSGVPFWQSELEAWKYKDAQLRSARDEAHQAQERLHELIDGSREVLDRRFFGQMARVEVALSGMRAEDPDSVANELQDWLRDVPCTKVEDDTEERANVRSVIDSTTSFAEKYPSHPQTEALLERCRSLVNETSSVLSRDLITRYQTVAR